MATLISLPMELHFEILYHLDLQSTIQFLSVNRRLRTTPSYHAHFRACRELEMELPKLANMGNARHRSVCFSCYRSLLRQRFPRAADRICDDCDRDKSFMVSVNDQALLPWAVDQNGGQYPYGFTVEFIQSAVARCSFHVVEPILWSNRVPWPGGLCAYLIDDLYLTREGCNLP